MPRSLPRWLRHIPILVVVIVCAVTTGGGFPH
jgi:hypothetical protein